MDLTCGSHTSGPLLSSTSPFSSLSNGRGPDEGGPVEGVAKQLARAGPAGAYTDDQGSQQSRGQRGVGGTLWRRSWVPGPALSPRLRLDAGHGRLLSEHINTTLLVVLICQEFTTGPYLVFVHPPPLSAGGRQT
jgi:hypothetical protein